MCVHPWMCVHVWVWDAWVHVLGVQSKLGLRKSLPLDHSGGGKSANFLF